MKKAMLFSAGCLCLLLGTIGIFLPILPTTPFVILAGICFSASSRKMYALLRKSALFGPYIENYRNKSGVPVAVKVKSISVLWILLAVSAYCMHKTWAYILFAAVGTGVSIHLLAIKTMRTGKKEGKGDLAGKIRSAAEL